MEVNDTYKLLSKPWQKFLAKFKDIDTLSVSEWKEVHLLGYFCKKYENHYSHKFALSFKNAPSKCAEIFLIKKTIAMLNATDMNIVKQYIDWIFENKIIPLKMNIRTIGFLTTPGFGNEFNIFKSKKEKIERSTELPAEYKYIADKLNLSVSTYGDLAFVKMALDKSSDDSRLPYKNFFDHLLQIGFKTSTLDNMI